MVSSQAGGAKIWLIIILVLVLGAAGAGAWMLLGKRGGASAASAAAVALPPAKPVFFKLEPFTVNLQSSNDGDRLLYVGITLELGNDASQQVLTDRLPQVRDRLLMVLSGQDATRLITSQGKQQLAVAIRGALTDSFVKDEPRLKVKDVLFTQFIVQ